jgi:hypothetical protein
MQIVLMLLVVVVAIVPFWRIAQRLGYSPYWSLALLLPFVNLGLLYYVAFMDWPIERGTQRLEEPE